MGDGRRLRLVQGHVRRTLFLPLEGHSRRAHQSWSRPPQRPRIQEAHAPHQRARVAVPFVQVCLDRVGPLHRELPRQERADPARVPQGAAHGPDCRPGQHERHERDAARCVPGWSSLSSPPHLSLSLRRIPDSSSSPPRDTPRPRPRPHTHAQDVERVLFAFRGIDFHLKAGAHAAPVSSQFASRSDAAQPLSKGGATVGEGRPARPASADGSDSDEDERASEGGGRRGGIRQGTRLGQARKKAGNDDDSDSDFDL